MKIRVFILAIALGASTAFAADPAETKAKFIYQRLTNKIINTSNPTFQGMVQLLKEGKDLEAAEIATKELSFIDSVARIWSTGILSRDTNPNIGLTDSMAYLLGSVRDNLDARLLLTGDYAYGADPRFGANGRPSPRDNQIFENLELQGKELSRVLWRYSPQWDLASAKDTAGILTTRAWARENYSNGTNRRVIPHVLESFLCAKVETWRKPNLPSHRIRQDIDRFPQGDASVFQNDCRSCHAVMDGLAGAFSKIDFQGEQILWSTSVLEKYKIHTDIYPEGFVTQDETWINYLEEGGKEYFGWRTPMKGRGLQQFGQMLANSVAFSRCMAKRTIQVVCRQDLNMKDPFVVQVADQFVERGRPLKDLFKMTAVHPKCSTAKN